MRLTWKQYHLILDRATLMYEAAFVLEDLEAMHRWSMVQLRIMSALCNKEIFWRN